jgi:hypothetical protein
MAVVDLGLLLLAGAWLERGARAVAAWAIAASLLACGIAVSWSGFASYRGSSGVAVGLLVAALLHAIVASRGVRASIFASVALALTAVKIWWEWHTGVGLAAGPLPEGVTTAPAVHAAGALAGGVVVVGSSIQARLRPSRRPG